jgi:hypothetical protein
MSINEDTIQMWFDQALTTKKPKMIPFLKFCAENGKIERLEENINYYKIDLCVDMINLMDKEGYKIKILNISFKFDHKIESKTKGFFAEYLIKAKRIRLKETQQTTRRASLRKKK